MVLELISCLLLTPSSAIQEPMEFESAIEFIESPKVQEAMAPWLAGGPTITIASANSIRGPGAMFAVGIHAPLAWRWPGGGIGVAPGLNLDIFANAHENKGCNAPEVEHPPIMCSATVTWNRSGMMRLDIIRNPDEGAIVTSIISWSLNESCDLDDEIIDMVEVDLALFFIPGGILEFSDHGTGDYGPAPPAGDGVIPTDPEAHLIGATVGGTEPFIRKITSERATIPAVFSQTLSGHPQL